MPNSTRHPHRAACALHAQKYRISARFCRLFGNNAAKWGGSRRFACCTAPIRRPHCRTALFPTTCAVPIEHRNTKSMQSKRNRGRATEYRSIPGIPFYPNARRADSTGKSGRKSIPDCPMPPRSHNRTAPIRRPHCRTASFPTACAELIGHKIPNTRNSRGNRRLETGASDGTRHPHRPHARRATDLAKPGRKSIPDCSISSHPPKRTAPIWRTPLPAQHRSSTEMPNTHNFGGNRWTHNRSTGKSPKFHSAPMCTTRTTQENPAKKSIPEHPASAHLIAIHPHPRPCASKYQIHEIPEIAGTSATGAPPVPAFPSAPHTHNVSAQNAAFPRKSLQNAAISCKIAQPTNPHDSEPFCAQMSQNFRFSRDYVASRQPLQTSTHPNEPEYFSNSGILSSIALLPLPHAGKTLSNRFNDSSR